jgi:protease-4
MPPGVPELVLDWSHLAMKCVAYLHWTLLSALVMTLGLALPTRSAVAQDSATAEAEQQEAAEEEDQKEEDKEASDDKADAKESKKSPPKVEKVRFAKMLINSDMPEAPSGSGLFGDLQIDLRSLLARLEKARQDDTISGLVLEIDNPGLGRGKINEVRQAIARFRKQGKKVYAQLEMALPEDYLLATACDEIVMPESGVLVLPGVRMEAMFYRGAFAKLGVKADFLHMGDAKGAAESLTRRSFSKPVKENLTSLVDDMYDQMVETIAQDRKLEKVKVVELIDKGMLTAGKAKECGLVDRIAYPHELRATLDAANKEKQLVYVENYGKKEVDTDFSGPAGFFKLLSAMSGGKSSGSSADKKIAVVYAVGAIMTGESEQDLFGGLTVGSDTIVEALRKASNDDKVAAIVLRIDSPGGSAIASDLMWSEIQNIEKPIIASMGDVAASGGYYIAMGTDHIYAEPTTITGSIGVVGGKIAMKGLYDKLGVSTDTIARGKNSGIFSSNTGFTPSEKEVFEAMMRETYEQFTTKAAEGRKMELDKLKQLAGGRVYTGRQAKENGLVDELGTLEDAIAKAKKLAGLKDDDKVKIETLPEPVDFFDSLFGNTDAEKEVRLGLESLSPELKQLAAKAARWQRVFREPVVLMMPFEVEIK